MDRVTQSPQLANFHVTADGSEVSGLFAHAQLSTSKRDQVRPPILSRGPWRRSGQPNYLDDARVWWDAWVPVATTGWGALGVIAPLIVTHFLIWATGVTRHGVTRFLRRRRGSRPRQL